MSTTHGRKPWLIAALGLLSVLVLYGLWRLVFAASPVQSTNDAYVSADFTLVAPKVAGFIDKVLVQDNQAVKAGQLLARIDPKTMKRKCKQPPPAWPRRRRSRPMHWP